MTKHIYTYKVLRAFTFFIVCLVLNTACVKDPLGDQPNVGEIGKPAKVSLSLAVSSLTTPSASASEAAAKSMAENSGNSKLNVSLEERLCEDSPQTSLATRATEKASLYNLWVMQFGTDKRLVKASKMSNTPEPVKEMITIDADLIVGTKQTLYLVCLGYQHDNVDLSTIKNIAELESFPIPSIRYVNGVAQSIINEQRDIPYLGVCEGVDIVQIENDGRGYVKYNPETGFVGGISMRAMVSKITFNFSYDVANLTPSMMSLNNVPTSFCINPPIDYKPNSFVSLPAISFGGVSFESGQRYETSWYVAPNRQGEVSSITKQEDRYFYYLSGTATGTAPSDGTYINIWASDKGAANRYALYYIFLGSNTSSDFNVHPQTHYILRSDINTAPNENDNRVIYSVLEQKIDFNVSGNYSSTPKPSKSGDKYDLDASAGRRPIEISTLRGTVTVEILKRGDDIDAMPVGDSWMQLSTSSNYTDALNRKNSGDQSALTTKIQIKTDIPGLIKLYLYHDEYLSYTTSDPSTTDRRWQYVRFTFSTDGQPDESFTYYMYQKCAFYLGQIGGVQNPLTGVYSHGLAMSDKFNGNGEDYLSYHKDMSKLTTVDQLKVLKVGTYPDVTSYQQAVTEFGVNNRENGMMATMLYAENSSGYKTIETPKGVVTEIPAPRRVNGKLDLYQYQGKYNSAEGFAARWCYDKNRDKNGNGQIDYLPNDPDNNEMIWYLPSINQLRNLGLNFFGSNYYSVTQSLISHYLLSSTMHTLNTPYWIRVYAPATTTIEAYEVRCVRDIKLPVILNSSAEPVFTAPKVGEVDGYAVIDASGLVTGASANKTKGDTSYINNDGRNIRHEDYRHEVVTIGAVTSARFRVAPHNIDAAGKKATGEEKMNWAQASGYNEATNSLAVGLPVFSAETGCPMYQGVSSDPSLGKWRLPTLNEMILIEMMEESLEATTGFTPLSFPSVSDKTGTSFYWTATELHTDSENAIFGKNAWTIRENYNSTTKEKRRHPVSVAKSSSNFVRCVQDIP